MIDVPPPACLAKPLHFPHKKLFGPGPSNVSPRVLATASMPLLGHMHQDMYDIMDEIKEGLRYVMQTRNRVTLAVSGPGHAAMEASCVNLVEPGENVLVAVAGLWGMRFADMVRRSGANACILEKPFGSVFSLAEIEKALTTHRPTVMFITHGESSGTVCQPLEGLGALCHRYNCLLVVDSVASLGGTPFFMDRWEVDCLYAGSQKVLACPPGASPISVSERAWRKITNRKAPIQSFILDLTGLANYWGCDSQPRKYHHTGPISTFFALRESLAGIAEEGLEAMWERHRKCQELMVQGLQDMGLNLIVSNPAHRLPIITGIWVPSDIKDWKSVPEYVMKKWHMEIAGGMGPSVGKIWRIGIMGYNAQPENVTLALRALKDGLDYVRSSQTASRL